MKRLLIRGTPGPTQNPLFQQYSFNAPAWPSVKLSGAKHAIFWPGGEQILQVGEVRVKGYQKLVINQKSLEMEISEIPSKLVTSVCVLPDKGQRHGLRLRS